MFSNKVADQIGGGVVGMDRQMFGEMHVQVERVTGFSNSDSSGTVEWTWMDKWLGNTGYWIRKHLELNVKDCSTMINSVLRQSS